jgi:GNAT superfamily N-acetyltransferase
MSLNWKIRPYQAGDETQILKLRRIVFGDLDPVRLKKSTWQWQFRDNPAGPAFCFIAEAEGAIVGQYAAISTRFLIEEKEALLAFSCDTMIHPDYRRQGVFLALANALYDIMTKHHGITTVWGFPNNQSLPGFRQRLGWRMRPNMPLLVMPIRPLSMVCRALPLLKRPGKKHQITRASGVNFKFSIKLTGLQIDPIHKFDETFDDLWQTHCARAPVMQIRDSRYLQWRYLAVSEFDYRPFAIRYNGRLTGYMVLRMMAVKGHLFGALVDLFPFSMAPESLLNEIFCLARQYVKAHGGDFLTCLCPQLDPRVLKKAGFRKVPEIINPKTWRLGCRCTEAAIGADLDRWHITFGDTDVV